MIGYAVALIVITFVYTIFYFERCKKSWRDLGVKSPTFLPGQSEVNVFRYDRRKLLDEYYKKYKSDGMFVTHSFTGSILYLCDLDLIKDIGVKNIDHFSARGATIKGEFLSKTVLTASGKRWKDLRELISKVFTSGKIKSMFNIVQEKGDNINIRLEKDMETKEYTNLGELAKSFTVDVSATSVFGLDSDCLKAGKGSNPLPEFFGRKKPRSILKAVLSVFLNTAQVFLDMVRIHLPLAKDVTYLNTLLETIRDRKTSGQKVGDFLDLLLEAGKGRYKNQNTSSYELNIAYQSTLLVVAGFDTVMNGLYYAIYYLAKYPEKQRKLRRELEEKLLGDGKFNYENLLDCFYLEAAFSEALRLNPPVNTLMRRCTKDYANKEKNIFIKKNTEIYIELYSLHHDPDYWKDPEEYLPERFLPENKDKIVPYSYNPFGLGLKICVALRFAKMECKIALAKIFLNNEISLLPGSEDLVLAKSYGLSAFFSKPDLDKVKIVAKKIERK